MKRKLLFVAAVVASALGFHANAQKDVTETYLVNPNFEISPTFDGTSLGESGTNATPVEGAEKAYPETNAVNVYKVEGWTNLAQPADVNDYERLFTMPYGNTLYVQSDNKAGGQAVAAPANASSDTSEDNKSLLIVAASWSPNVVLGVKQDVTLPKGVYKLAFDSYATTSVANAISLCGVKVGGNATYAWPAAIDKWENNELYFVVNEDDTPVEISMGYTKTQSTGGGATPFLFVDNVKLYFYNSNVPVESIPATDKIVNPNADEAFSKGWTAAGTNVTEASKINSTGKEKYDGNFFEPSYWGGAAWYSTIKQTLTGLENGLYTLKAVVMSAEGVNTVLTAGTSHSAAFPATGTANGNTGSYGWNKGEVTALVTDGELEIGVYSAATVKEKWTNIDNFTLSYIPMSALEAEPIVGEFKGAGIYYLYNEYTGKFLSRGSWWGTRAVADEYGLPIKVSLDGEGLYNLAALDNSEAYYGQDYWMYSDKAKNDGDYRTYRINEVEGMEGTYTITVTTLNQSVYINTVEGNDYGVANNAETESTAETEATYWKFLTKEQRDAILEEKDAAQAKKVAGKAGLESLEGLEPVGEPTVLSFAAGVTNWENEATSDRKKAVNKGDYGTEVYEETEKLTQSVEGLEEGLYLVTVKGFYRDGWNEAVYNTYHTDGYDCVLSYLNANGATVRIANWAEEAYKSGSDYVPNNTGEAKTLFDTEGDKYTRSVITYVGKSGKLDLTIMSTSFVGGSWLILNNVTYTKIEEPAEVETVETDLTDDMFHDWDGFGADANITGNVPNIFFESHLGEKVSAGTTIYGNGNVSPNSYAALAEYDEMVVTYTTEGASLPRIVFGQLVQGGTAYPGNPTGFIEIQNAQSEFISNVSEDGLTWTIDLNKVKELKDGLANLNAIKATWGGSDMTITSVKLIKNEKAITFNVTEAGYATYVTPAALEFGEDEAFVVRKVQIGDDESVAILDNVTAAPAGTPVIIKGAGKHTFATATTEPDAIEGSLLHVAEGTESEGVYVLANLEERVGFYALDGVTLRKGIVYLEDEEAEEAGIKFIGFDGNGATAIKDVDVPTVENGIFYNLAGQRVQNPTKGIYIVNGKKVLVK